MQNNSSLNHFFIVLIAMCIFLHYRCSNSNDRASQVVICYVMTDLKIYISVYSITYSTHIHLVQQVTGPRITPLSPSWTSPRSNGPSDLVQGLLLPLFGMYQVDLGHLHFTSKKTPVCGIDYHKSSEYWGR